jgi:hypothetical protein
VGWCVEVQLFLGDRNFCFFIFLAVLVFAVLNLFFRFDNFLPGIW